MTKQISSGSDSSVIDRSALEAIVEIFGAEDSTAILDLLDTFLTESTKQVEEMRASLAMSDWVKLHRMAHSLKSSSATFGAMRLSRVSALLEYAAKEQCAAGECADLLTQLVDEHQVACTLLSAERAYFVGA